MDEEKDDVKGFSPLTTPTGTSPTSQRSSSTLEIVSDVQPTSGKSEPEVQSIIPIESQTTGTDVPSTSAIGSSPLASLSGTLPTSQSSSPTLETVSDKEQTSEPEVQSIIPTESQTTGTDVPSTSAMGSSPLPSLLGTLPTSQSSSLTLEAVSDIDQTSELEVQSIIPIESWTTGTDVPSTSAIGSSPLPSPSGTLPTSQSLSPTVETVSDVDQTARKSDIGPYAARVDLHKKNFTQADESLPVIETIKNGLVLELYAYLIKTHSLNSIAKIIIKLSGKSDETCKVKSVCSYVSELYSKERNLTRHKNVKSVALSNLREEEFKLVRQKRGSSKQEDTPRKKRLKREVSAERQQRKKVKKQLHLSEQKVNKLEVELNVSHGLAEKLDEETTKRKEVEQQIKKAEKDFKSAELNVHKAEKTIDVLQIELDSVKLKLKDTVQQLEDMQANFDPVKHMHEVENYKKRYEDQNVLIAALEVKYKRVSDQLSSLSTRNVNKRIKRRDEKIITLEQDHDVLTNLQADLEDTKAKLQQTNSVCKTLQSKLDKNRDSRTSLVKKVWYRDKKIQHLTSSCYSEDDIQHYQTRAEVLEMRVKELEDCISLCEDKTVTTFEDGKYTDSVRGLIMELLSLNVSMSSVNKVIRTTLKKMANIEVGRLPSSGTTSKIVTEARVLADIEVGLAMKESRPEDVLGNVIHGDGTTKYHKKYQNWQCTLADKTSRTTGLLQMGRGDTSGVVDAFKYRMAEIAAAVETISEEEDQDKIFKDLIVSCKSTMTDQGPTMPQFSDAVSAFRTELLPTVVSNWESMPGEVQTTIKDFGTFYCKMHPLINFAEEVNKTLKTYEDLATSGKNAHTIVTNEAGVTRLIRTASKAFHHRGSDKSGAEDEFTEYIQRQYGVQRNRLVFYIGNRANILFEGAATTLFHLNHMTSFVNSHLSPNTLLLAVCEDAEEKVHHAELIALAIIYKIITEPLWTAIKRTENVLSLNSTLHSLQDKLIEWKDKPEGLMRADTAIPNIEIEKDDLYECAFVNIEDVILHGMCIQALQLICCALLLILERQCQDNLPGGKYWETSVTTKERYANVPTTNLIGERDFAILDMLVRQKPSARTITLEALVMWMNNGTVKWLDGLDPQTKAKYMDAARRHSETALKHYQQRMKSIKQERWEKLQEKQKTREEKEKKAVEDKVKLTEDVVVQGGVWHKEKIEERFEEMRQSMSNEKIRRELLKQLLFHQRVLKSNAPQRDHFQLTTTISGKKHTFSKEEMRDHLITIAELNNITSTTNPDTMAQPTPAPPAVSYTDTLDLEDKFERKKIEIAKKIEDERKKRAVAKSKKHFERLVEAPDLLVGKRVEHKCVSPEGIPQWYPGSVESVTRSAVDGEKTVYTIRYDEVYLAVGEPVTEDFPLLKDLKKGDFIIVSPV